jgi:hypothetical protein
MNRYPSSCSEVSAPIAFIKRRNRGPLFQWFKSRSFGLIIQSARLSVWCKDLKTSPTNKHTQNMKAAATDFDEFRHACRVPSSHNEPLRFRREELTRSRRKYRLQL